MPFDLHRRKEPILFFLLALLWCCFAQATQVLMGSVSENSHVDMPVLVDELHGKNILLFQSDRWQVAREFPSGYIGVRRKNIHNNTWDNIDLTLEWRRRIHPMQIGEGVAGELLLISYDLIDNLPSGRSQKIVTNGIDVWRLKDKASKNDEPERILSNLQLGGIDSLVYADFSGNPFKICSENQCYSWVQGQEAVRWNLDQLKNYEFVELAFAGDQVAALIRQKHDDRQSGPLTSEHSAYHLATLNINGAVHSAVPDDAIPWKVQWKNGRPTYQMAFTSRQYQELFLFDMARMPMGGVMSFGSNNFEGRIAWSQAYYLHGMMSVLEGSVKSLFPRPPPGLREKVRKEVQLMADLCNSDYPGYLSKRYSIDREPVKSVLHLGRISSILMRAKSIVQVTLSNACIGDLKHQMAAFDGTLEDSTQLKVGKSNLPYLKIRKGTAFWADGINVPYNYVSAYVEGLLAMGPGDIEKSRLAGMLEVIRRQEFGEKYPQTWRYCGNICDAGWTRADGISVNAPSWSGNGKALAHVSYRTMDARALLELGRARPVSADHKLAEHFRELTRTGWLLPSMDEVFIKSGGIAIMSKDVVRRYARTAAPWEIQSSVWALNQLALDAGK